jgi:hypothetical protein
MFRDTAFSRAFAAHQIDVVLIGQRRGARAGDSAHQLVEILEKDNLLANARLVVNTVDHEISASAFSKPLCAFATVAAPIHNSSAAAAARSVSLPIPPSRSLLAEEES